MEVKLYCVDLDAVCFKVKKSEAEQICGIPCSVSNLTSLAESLKRTSSTDVFLSDCRLCGWYFFHSSLSLCFLVTPPVITALSECLT